MLIHYVGANVILGLRNLYFSEWKKVTLNEMLQLLHKFELYTLIECSPNKNMNSCLYVHVNMYAKSMVVLWSVYFFNISVIIEMYTTRGQV